MLQEEPEYFLVSERYVGNVKDPSMKIHLLDETSIQRNYNRVPKLLRQEIEMLRTYLIEVRLRGLLQIFLYSLILCGNNMIVIVFSVTINNLIPISDQINTP